MLEAEHGQIRRAFLEKVLLGLESHRERKCTEVSELPERPWSASGSGASGRKNRQFI